MALSAGMGGGAVIPAQGSAPSGPAGGDLSGSYPDPSVATIASAVLASLAAGDLLVGSAAGTLERLAKGAATDVLTVGGADPSGLQWAPPSGGGGGATDTLEVPADHSMLAWNFPAYLAGAQIQPAWGGRAHLTKLAIRSALSVSTVLLGAITAGNSCSGCFVGLYDVAGNLLSTSADVSPQFNAAGLISAPQLGAPIALSVGFVYVAIAGFGTQPPFLVGASNLAINVAVRDAGLLQPDAGLQLIHNAGGDSPLPASFNMASMSQEVAQPFWVALS